LVSPSTREALREVLAGAWSARYVIETEASVRFGYLAGRLVAAGAPRAVVDLAVRASQDETRHAGHCQRFFHAWGGSSLPAPRGLVEYAPTALSATERLTYEVVAQCCVAETQSTATLVTLLSAAETGELKSVLHELARDEVNHSRLGWAYLAWARGQTDFGFLGPLLPGMIGGSAGPEMFAPGPPEMDHPELLRQGVVPRSMRRRVYLETLDTVVLPGFESLGIDTGPARAWLGQKQAASPAASGS
jgi:hypothetical protein